MLVQEIAKLAVMMRNQSDGEPGLVSITVSETGRMALMRDAELLQHTPAPWLDGGHMEIAGVRVLMEKRK